MRMCVHDPRFESIASTSYEQRRCSACSEDIRWRIVWQRHAPDLLPKKIAANLSINCSTVRKEDISADWKCPKEALPC